MISSWLKKSTPTELINIIRENFSVTPDGRTGYNIESTFFFDALFSLVTHHHDLDNETLYSYFKSSLIRCFETNKIQKPDDILREFDRTVNTSKSKIKTFILVTSINVKRIYQIPRKTVHNSIISFHNIIPKKYASSRSKQIESQPDHDFSEQENFTFVTITTKAINPEHAFRNAMKSMDIVRSLLQVGFVKNMQLLSNNKEHEYPTKSIIQYGQAHTLHFPNGKSASDNFWYEPNYKKINAISLRSPDRTYKELSHRVRQLNKSPYYEHCLSIISSYADATDSKDTELRFMKLWVTLEKLTITDNSEKIAKRVAFFYEERALYERLMESLRCSRNTHIHGGNKPINIEQKNFQLCQIIDHLIKFTLANAFKLSSRQEIQDLISFPTESKTLKSQIASLKMVQKFIGE
ncbi:hypothetical protein I6U33_05190 [Pseudomonas carnis]|uniref:hypothetical protein n=1 Tax=Pseudomonas TaxID=286 RepID=UPI0018E76452|nr:MULTISPECIES: hypothetical protein [Pseudomonas]MBJ2225781.1 hypothetical protein [Pseudomonas sp. MF7451]MBW9236718.1 hypothetical protein [Pseudomonas carnis]